MRGDFLGAQVFFHRERVVGSAFDRGIVGDEYAFQPADPADSGDQSGGGDFVVINLIRCQLGELEKRGGGVEELADSFTWQQFAAVAVFFAGAFAAAEGDFGNVGAKFIAQSLHPLTIRNKRFVVWDDVVFYDWHYLSIISLIASMNRYSIKEDSIRAAG